MRPSSSIPPALLALALAFASAAGCERPKSLRTPAAAPDEASTVRTAAVTTPNVLANDQDGGAGPLAIAAFTQGSLGSVADNGDGTFTWSPLASIPSGDDQFSYTVRNGDGLTATATVTVHVAPSWGAVFPLPASASFNKATALDPLGNLTVLVDVAETAGTVLLAQRRDASFRWSDPVRLSPDPGGPISSYQLFTDAAGNAIALWHALRSDMASSHVWAARYAAAGGAWEPSRRLDPDDTSSSTPPVALLDSTGGLHAVWMRSDGTGSRTMAARLEGGSAGWGAPAVLLADVLSPSFAAQLVADGAGGVTVAWQQSDGTNYNVWVSRFAATAGWGAAQLATETRVPTTYFDKLVVDAQGTATVVADQFDGAAWSVWSRSAGADGVWSAARRLSATSGLLAALADQPGTVKVLWLQESTPPGRMELWSDSWQTSTGFNTGVVRLDVGTAGPGVGEVRTAADGHGGTLAVWVENDGPTAQVWAARRGPQGSWSAARRLCDTAGNGNLPPWIQNLLFDAAGNATVLWVQNDGTLDHAWAAHYVVDSGLWSAGAKIEQNEQHSVANVRSLIDASGTVTASIRLQEAGTVDRVFITRMSPAGAWEPLVQVGTSAWGSNTPYLFLGPAGQLLAVWASQVAETQTEVLATRWSGTAWSPAQRLAGPGGFAGSFRVAFGPGPAETLLATEGPYPTWSIDYR